MTQALTDRSIRMRIALLPRDSVVFPTKQPTPTLARGSSCHRERRVVCAAFCGIGSLIGTVFALPTFTWMRVLALGILAFLTGCTSPVATQNPGLDIASSWNELMTTTKPDNLQAPLTQSSEASVDQRWWGHFADPLLDALIAEAMTGNKTLQIAKARVEEARAGRVAVRSSLFPQLNGAAGVQRANLGFFSSDQTINFSEAEVTVSWEMDLFGRNQARVAEASALVESATAAQQAVRVGLLAEVARTYFEMRNYQRQTDLAERNFAIQQRTLAIVQQKKAENKASDLDVERAAYQVSATGALLPALRTAVNASKNRLAVLLGNPPGSKDAVLVAKQELPPLDPHVLIAAPAEVLAGRPDIRAAERRFAASISAKSVAEKAWLPDISLMGFFGRQSTTPLNSTAWGMGTNLVQPILNFGAIQGQIDAADARQKQAFLDYQQTVLAAVENMENALSAYLSETTRNARLMAAAGQSRKAATLVHQQYDSGYASFLDVLDAERTQLVAESALSASDFALRENLVNIYAAAGGGWRDDARSEGNVK